MCGSLTWKSIGHWIPHPKREKKKVVMAAYIALNETLECKQKYDEDNTRQVSGSKH